MEDVEKKQLQLERAIKLGRVAQITQFISHRGARVFWHRHLPDAREAKWDLFVDILKKLERDSKQPTSRPLNAKELGVLKTRLDQNNNGSISVYGSARKRICS